MSFDCPHVAEIRPVPASQLPSGTTMADIGPDALVEGGFPLGTWVTTYRERGREGALDDDQRAALEAILGWSW